MSVLTRCYRQRKFQEAGGNTKMRMFFLVVWQCMILSVTCRHDTPIVIERPMNRVEFDDLLMEYNKDQGPNSDVSVFVDITVNSARLSEDVLRTSLTLEQKWTDPRLMFKGVSEVPVLTDQCSTVASRHCDHQRVEQRREGDIDFPQLRRNYEEKTALLHRSDL
ncbi:hypothetical protein ANCCAN_14951 [Ancylostoma caninum]|uniref:Neurotransmitter-gated ion-channel ligand-binding domain-containing protein n=1 Tax=Ancylostoma caninum TaxID=29170 RepID=A0A368G3U8_ANCCA|nr:hypothetical protein ANCCAN_14951 [Ancylostoma caninum]